MTSQSLSDLATERGITSKPACGRCDKCDATGLLYIWKRSTRKPHDSARCTCGAALNLTQARTSTVGRNVAATEPTFDIVGQRTLERDRAFGHLEQSIADALFIGPREGWNGRTAFGIWHEPVTIGGDSEERLANVVWQARYLARYARRLAKELNSPWRCGCNEEGS